VSACALMRSGLISRMRRTVVGKFVDEHRAFFAARLIHDERGDDAPPGIVVEYALNQAGSPRAFVANLRQIVGQYIAGVVAPEPVVVVAEAVADKQRPDPA